MIFFYYILFLSGLGSGFFNENAFILLFDIMASYTAIGFMLFTLLLIVALSEDSNYPLFPLFLGYLGLSYYRGIFNPIYWIYGYPLEIICGIIGYIIIGMLWSIPKLKIYMKSKDGRKLIKRLVNQNNNNKDININININKGSIIGRILSDRKMLIYSWILYWPLNIIHTFTHDLINKLFDFIFDNIKQIYKKIISDEIDNYLVKNK